MRVQTAASQGATAFRAAAAWSVNRVVGVTMTNRMLWFRTEGNKLVPWAAETDLASPTPAVAAFPSRTTDEVLVLLQDGELLRVPVPA